MSLQRTGMMPVPRKRTVLIQVLKGQATFSAGLNAEALTPGSIAQPPA
jgi:quercetin dioxygenase-like cupin family protein